MSNSVTCLVFVAVWYHIPRSEHDIASAAHGIWLHRTNYLILMFVAMNSKHSLQGCAIGQMLLWSCYHVNIFFEVKMKIKMQKWKVPPIMNHITIAISVKVIAICFLNNIPSSEFVLHSESLFFSVKSASFSFFLFSS